MRKLFLLLLFVSLGLYTASSALAETKTVQAYCELPQKKIVTNVVTVTVDVDTSSDNALYVVQKVSEAIASKASQTLYAMGINSEGSIRCTFSDPTLMEANENKPIDYLRTLPDSDVSLGYRLVTVSGFGDTEQAASSTESDAASSAESHIYFCDTTVAVKEHDYLANTMVPSREVYAIVETMLPKDELVRQWNAAAPAQTQFAPDCYERASRADAENDLKGFLERGVTMNRIDFAPKEPATAPSQRKAETVPFRSPHGKERGYLKATFEIEYQFLVCSGELHIAYSLVDGSARASSNGLGSYAYNGHWYDVQPPAGHIESVPIKGTVWLDDMNSTPIGHFGDNFVGKALGFGCFSGQTQKVADKKELSRGYDKQYTDEEVTNLFDRLIVKFETNEVLTDAAAEDAIRAQSSKSEAANDDRGGKAAGDAVKESPADKAADERAARRAAEDAEFQAKQKAYEKGMAEHQAALQQYQKALADNEAQKAANEAAAKAQREEFARKQAAYEAEVARARQAQEEYEAKYGRPQ